MSKARLILLLLILASFSALVLYKLNSNKTEKKVVKNDLAEVGRYLFFDTRLSFNNTKSCASCHDPKFAFSDGYRRSITANGDIVLHNAPSLINSAALFYFDWANPGINSLEKQHERPLYGEHPVELGVTGNEREILIQLQQDTLYQHLFPKIFPAGTDPFTFPNIISAIAAYVRSLKSSESAYDNYINGNKDAISESAIRGMKLFSSNKLKCASCHVPPDFTLASVTRSMDSIYYNTGLYNISNLNQYPVFDSGLSMISGKQKDNGKFKIPSLRNVAITAPYMHDGSVNTLEEVITIYANGGRNISSGPNRGNGIFHQNKDKRISGFSLNHNEEQDLIDFLYALTDSTISANPHFTNPWRNQIH